MSPRIRLEDPLRTLTRRVSVNAVANPQPVADSRALTSALAAQPRPTALGGATVAALAARVARRFRPLRFLGRRTPLWLAAAAVPAVHASVTRGAEELSLVASHLVHRARAAGIHPDPERVRRVAVQLVAGLPVQPDSDGGHGVLMAGWLQQAVRSTFPLMGTSTRDAVGLAWAAGAVPPAALGRPVDEPPPALPGTVSAPA